MGKIKLPQKELIIAAFFGGMITSILELANMLATKSHDDILDPYFWLGVLVAGIIGIAGLLVSRAKDLGGALTSGIAAPQLLGGLSKVAPTVATLLLSPLNIPIYAGENIPDSISVKTIVEGNYKVLEIRPVNSNQKGILIRDTMYLKLPAGNLEIYGKGYKSVQFQIDKDTIRNKEVVIIIKTTDHIVKNEQQPPINRLLRGIFGHSHRKDAKEIKNLELSVEEKILTKDSTEHE